MVQYIKHELKKIFLRWETWVVLAICFAVALAGIIETLSFFPDRFIETAKPRYHRSMLRSFGTGHIWLLFLGFIAASIPCACSYFEENTNKSDIILISKIGRTQYYMSKYIVTAIVGFIISVLPLAIHYVLCMIAVPGKEALILVTDVYANGDSIIEDTTIFTRLFMNHPDLTAFVHIGIFGLWGMMLTLFTYTISLFFRKKLILNLVISTILSLAFELLLNSFKLWNLEVYSYLNPGPGSYNTNFPAFMILWCAFMLINAVMLAVKIKAKKDIL